MRALYLLLYFPAMLFFFWSALTYPGCILEGLPWAIGNGRVI